MRIFPSLQIRHKFKGYELDITTANEESLGITSTVPLSFSKPILMQFESE